MDTTVIGAWFIAALIVGWLGDGRKIGFWVAFLFSVILSPLIGFIIVILSKKVQVVENVQNLQPNIVKEAEPKPVYVQPNPQPNIVKETTERHNTDFSTLSDNLVKLKDLLDKGIITKEEFNREKAKVLNN